MIEIINVSIIYCTILLFFTSLLSSKKNAEGTINKAFPTCPRCENIINNNWLKFPVLCLKFRNPSSSVDPSNLYNGNEWQSTTKKRAITFNNSIEELRFI